MEMFSNGFQIALELLKRETDCNIWAEGNRMRINYSFYDYEFCYLDEFFQKVIAFCEKKKLELKKSRLVFELIIEVTKEEEKKLIRSEKGETDV